jgi:AsmA protein
MMRKLLMACGAVIVLLVLVVAGLAAFLDVNQFRPRLEQEMTRAVGRKVSLGNISLALMSGSVAVANVSIGDDPAYGGGSFVTAKEVKIGVELLPLLISRSLQVRGFTLEEPRITVRRSGSGQWNFSTLGAHGASSAKPNADGGSAASGLSIARLAIVNGQVTVIPAAGHGRNRVYEAVNIEATNLSYTSQFPFRLSAKTPGGGTVRLDGKAGPMNAADVSATPLDASVDVKHLDLAATGFVDPSSGIAGIVDFSGRLTSDGHDAHSKGTLTGTALQFLPGGAPSQVPVRVDYNSAYDVKRESGTIDGADVHIGKALAHLNGSFKTEGAATAVRVKIAGHQMPVPELQASLPAVGVTLPSGASLKGGTLDLDLIVSGAIDRLVTTGSISVANTTLTGFDLGSKMAAVAAFAGVPKSANTVIQTLRSNVRVAPEGIRLDALELVVPAVGQLTGGGTIASQGAMDFKMLAHLTSKNAVTSAVVRTTSLGHPENGTPFLIKGTTSSPMFAPDASAMVHAVANKENATKAASGLLKGLLGKKPK